MVEYNIDAHAASVAFVSPLEPRPIAPSEPFRMLQPAEPKLNPAFVSNSKRHTPHPQAPYTCSLELDLRSLFFRFIW